MIFVKLSDMVYLEIGSIHKIIIRTFYLTNQLYIVISESFKSLIDKKYTSTPDGFVDSSIIIQDILNIENCFETKSQAAEAIEKLLIALNHKIISPEMTAYL